MFRARGLRIELRVKFELKVQARGERNVIAVAPRTGKLMKEEIDDYTFL